MSIVNDYIKAFDSPQKEGLELIRDITTTVAPQAQEAISYNMPAYKIDGQYLIWFAAFKHHISIFPASDKMVAALGGQLAKLRTSTGTIQFSLDKPLPEDLIRHIVRYRLEHIGE